jgi:rhodanese-related sulfurtransferase
VQTAAYWGLGLTGASFVATFFVAPQFKDQFKEDVDWRDIYNSLQSTGVKQVDATDAYAKSKSGGAVLVDVRLGNKYDSSHAAGALSIPLYNPIQNWDLPSIIRRAGFAFFGIYGTELNTNFADDVLSRIPRGKQVIVVCENGGTLENKSGTKYGFQSRSLKAIYYLQQAGFKNVSYVKGGVAQWAREQLPLSSGPDDGSIRFDEDDNDEGPGSGSRVGTLKLPQLNSLFSR